MAACRASRRAHRQPGERDAGPCGGSLGSVVSNTGRGRVFLRNSGSCGISEERTVKDNVPRLLPTTGAADRKSTRLNSSHGYISYAVFCLKKKKTIVQSTFSVEL